jgi:Transcriptional regulator
MGQWMNSIHLDAAMHNRVTFKSIQAFEAAARLSSFALAADELFVTPSPSAIKSSCWKSN